MGLFNFIEKSADFAFAKISTPAYVALCVAVFSIWIVFNSTVIPAYRFDTYPYLLLTLVLSAQAMVTAPLIMIAQRKAEKRDRAHEETQRRKDEEYNIHMLDLLESIQSLVRAIRQEMEKEFDELHTKQ